MKQCYVRHRFSDASMRIVEQANEIVDSYQIQGFDLTLRQLYYQFVSRGLIPNRETEYHKLGCIINDARLAGLIDWEAIIDRTRTSRGNTHWTSPSEILDAVALQFKLDTRSTQPNYIEVWVEKDALIGVLELVCKELDIPYFSCRGYVSQSSMWEAAQRFITQEDAGRETHLIHLGDHDPSGVDMSRDIQDRLSMFTSTCEVTRIALTMKQVRKYSPPPNPAKLTDSRCGGYIELYGEESWELDALDPTVITTLIRGHVETLTDEDLRDDIIEKQDLNKDQLRHLSTNWTKVEKWLKNKV